MHDAIDLFRDILSAVIAGLLLMGIGGYRAYRRKTKERLDRHAVEILHTQKETDVDSFYPDSKDNL